MDVAFRSVASTSHRMATNDKPMADISAARAAELIQSLSPRAVEALNAMARDALWTRGGRAGSGLGSLIEALWGFMLNGQLDGGEESENLHLAWFPDHAYNDFALIFADRAWNPSTRDGELLRVEAKSMFSDADESKGHFDVIQSEIQDDDLLLVLVWEWFSIRQINDGADQVVAPQVTRSFIGPARIIATLRDELHLARGGSFVSPPCPDGCPPGCSHIGEPLNADGKRERRSGPESRKPRSASYAANFGGLVRMLKTNSEGARTAFRRLRKCSDLVHEFVSFIHAAFPDEEANQYLVSEWREVAAELGIDGAGRMARRELIAQVRMLPQYRDALRRL